MNVYELTFYRNHGDDVDLETRTVTVESDVAFSDLDEGDQDSLELVIAEAMRENDLGDDWNASHIHNADGDVASVPDDM